MAKPEVAVALVPAALIGAIGVVSINTSVRGEAQSRVNHDLEIVASGYRDQLARLAYALESASGRVSSAGSGLPETLAAVKRELDLTVLNLCDSDGRPIAGTHPDPARRIPLERDPVTIFLGDVRVATNVLAQHSTRAIGTWVSETVRDTVLENGIVTISVRKDGAGFPPAEAERLFDKFYRVRDANTHSKRGSGIGLFTVRHIAELHGGRAWAESEPGAWAASHFSFPLEPPAAA